ncbi:hypothetical protein MM239_04840 [Belliella sp. DSM 111904]|uniref:Uncharacterized protein n=1 Tax=Belliella filtrata TaxID=2923435 RepID=A0ABS9UX09_9BACT|nr:hypothetical protein [Belliella filtrata]MCH7408710.1 hypothetical protein [Belliella filtrata]
MAKARKLLLNESITPEDYKEMKRDCEAEITSLEIELAKVAPPLDLQPIKFLDSVLKMASNIDNLYVTANVELKRRIFGSIYPKNWCFDGTQHRTTLVNEALRSFYLINNMLESKKISPKSKFSTLDSVVDSTINISNRLSNDVDILKTLYQDIVFMISSFRLKIYMIIRYFANKAELTQ